MCFVRRQSLNFAVNDLDAFKRLGGTGNLDWERIKPDFSLSQFFSLPQDTGVRPCATVEIKRPARILYAWKPTYEEQDEGKTNETALTDRKTVALGVSEKAATTGSTTTSTEAQSTGNVVTRATEVAATMPPAAEVNLANEPKESILEVAGSAKRLARFCNLGFGDIYWDAQHESLTERPPAGMITPIAQALTQGLISESGCCELYNHQRSIAFKRCGMHPENP